MAKKTPKSKKLNPKKSSPKQHPMEKLLAEKGIRNIKKGAFVTGKLISLSRKRVLFDIGAKTSALLGERELKEISSYLPFLKENQTINLRVVSAESKDGYPVVSMRNFFELGKWEILKEKMEKEETITVVCGDYGKGGVFVNFSGVRGVIPRIQLTQEFIIDPHKLRNQKINVRVLEADKEKNRLVVSQKAATFNISHESTVKKFNQIKLKKRYKAKVLGTSEFGIFCEVEGVEGLVHISEISWEKISSASRYSKIGDTIEVVVVEKNPKNLKLNLSIKRLTQDPWQGISKEYPKNKAIEGELVRKEVYGYFVRLKQGVEGLIHISKLRGDENLKIGDKIKVYVERIDEKGRRMSLLLPQKEKPVTYR